MLLKKELCITTSMQVQTQVREVLKQNNIAYDVETTSRNTIMQLQASNHGMDLIYRIYVRKKDYDIAKNLIRSITLAP